MDSRLFMVEDALAHLRLASHKIREPGLSGITSYELRDLGTPQVAVDEQHLLHLSKRTGKVERYRGLALLWHRRGDDDNLVRMIQCRHQHTCANRANRLCECRLRIVEECQLRNEALLKKALNFLQHAESRNAQTMLDVDG